MKGIEANELNDASNIYKVGLFLIALHIANDPFPLI
jgi:hypothetical protein